MSTLVSDNPEAHQDSSLNNSIECPEQNGEGSDLEGDKLEGSISDDESEEGIPKDIGEALKEGSFKAVSRNSLSQ